MGACASAPAIPYEIEAYFATVKANFPFIGNMPFLILETKKPSLSEPGKINHGWAYVYADGPLPQEVSDEFKFVAKEGSTTAKADLADCPSTALLLTALVDKHGWTLFSASAGGSNRPFQQFILTKPAAAA